MGFNVNRLNKAFRKMRSFENLDKVNFVNRELNDKNSFVIVPFTLQLGYINNAEIGKFSSETSINSLTQFNRIFTGTDNMLARWENAYEVTRGRDKRLRKKYKVGNWFRGYITSEVMGSNFSANSFDESFITWKNQRQLTFVTNYDLGDKDIYKLFVLPEISGNAFWYIAPNGLIKAYSDDKKKVQTEITLIKLNGELSKTGQALEQFIQMGAAGEGYAWPVVKNGEVTLDESKMLDTPIQEIQKEYNGVASISTFYAWGRPTYTMQINGITFNTFNDTIDTPRILLPFEMKTPEPSPLTTRGANETDFYVVKEAVPTFEQDFPHWKSYLEQNKFNSLDLKKYEGFLSSVETIAAIRKTNPEANGQTKYTIFNNNFRVDFSNQSYYNNVSPILANSQITFKNDTTLNIAEIMSHNVFLTDHLLTLPMSLKNNIQWNIEDIPLIGGYLSKVFLGVPVSWKNTVFRIANKPIALIVPKTICEYTQQIESSQQIKIPLNYFGEESNDLIKDVGVSSVSTNIKVTLTDNFSKTNEYGIKSFYKTAMLTEKNGNGTPQVLWDATCKPEPPTGAGFVIDAVIDKAISKSKTRLSCFSNGHEVWQGSYNTKSLYTGNIRDWATIVKMSDWKIDKMDSVAWPHIINPISPNEFVNGGVVNETPVKPENFKLPISLLHNATFLLYENGSTIAPQTTSRKTFTNDNYVSMDLPDNITSLADLQSKYPEITFEVNGTTYTIETSLISTNETTILQSQIPFNIMNAVQLLDTNKICYGGGGFDADYSCETRYKVQRFYAHLSSSIYATLKYEAQKLVLAIYVNIGWFELGSQIWTDKNPENENRDYPANKPEVTNNLNFYSIEYIAKK